MPALERLFLELNRLQRSFFATALMWPIGAVLFAAPGETPEPPSKAKTLETMRRATAFMTEKVSTNGGYVWSYLPDLSRRWGELEAKPTMIWLQPPGTGSMGHLFLDAYHATGDEYYYQAAEGVAAALIRAQHPSGGWNYVFDLAGEDSLRQWYSTVGRNAWRLEEFQHYYGNATFDDGGTAECAKFLLRLYVEKHDPKYRPALDKAIHFVIASQYPVGGWPQRFPRAGEFSLHGRPDYTGYITLNDDVVEENVDFLIKCHQALDDKSLIEPIRRGMDCIIATQHKPPQAGWALQYTLDLKPAGARSYEPAALATHTTASCIEMLLRYYQLTGEKKYLAPIPPALDWLDSVRVPEKTVKPGRTHPTFLEVGTNKPIYLHRRGSNVFNGDYYTDDDPTHTVAHYGSFRQIDVAALRQKYRWLSNLPVEKATQGSPLLPGARPELPRFFMAGSIDFKWLKIPPPKLPARLSEQATRAIKELNDDGWWPVPLRTTSRPYTCEGSKERISGDYAETVVGDETDTSPFPDPKPVTGITTHAYIHNMCVLIEYLAHTK